MQVEIRLFPHKCSPTARKVASFHDPDLLEKNDENDVLRIYWKYRQILFLNGKV